MIDGDGWQFGDPPTTEELRRHMQNEAHLLIELPWARGPVECKIGRISPNGEFFTIEPTENRGLMRMRGHDWFAIKDTRVVDVLTKPKQYHNSRGHGDAPVSLFETEDEV